MPTIAEKWLQEGIEKGVEKGIGIGVEKGIGLGVEKGVEKTYVKIVKRMLKNNMSAGEIHKVTGISLAKIEQIRRQLKRA